MLICDWLKTVKICQWSVTCTVGTDKGWSNTGSAKCNWHFKKIYKETKWLHCYHIKYTLSELFIRYLLYVFFYTYRSSAAAAYPLRMFQTFCVQWCSSAYQCCNVWLFALLSPSCQLWPVRALLLWPPSFSVSLPAELLLTGFFFVCFSHHSLQTLEAVVCENPRRSAVSEILKPPYLAPTITPIIPSRILRDLISSPFLNLVWKAEQLDQVCMLLCMLLLADYILILNLNKLMYRPNKVATECTIISTNTCI